MTQKKLNVLQLKILLVLLRDAKQSHFVSDIAEHLPQSDRSHVRYQLKLLADRGLVQIDWAPPRKMRGGKRRLCIQLTRDGIQLVQTERESILPLLAA